MLQSSKKSSLALKRFIYDIILTNSKFTKGIFMLDRDYTEDYTKDAEIIYEFHVDEGKKYALRHNIEESISLCTGIFTRFKKKMLNSFLKELDNLQNYYITDNNYLYTYDTSERNVKRVFNLDLAYNLSKSSHEYIHNNGDCFISALVDSYGYGAFERNEEGDYIGCFGFMDGTIGLTLWDVFEEDVYSILKKYIKEENTEVKSILPEYEL